LSNGADLVEGNKRSFNAQLQPSHFQPSRQAKTLPVGICVTKEGAILIAEFGPGAWQPGPVICGRTSRPLTAVKIPRAELAGLRGWGIDPARKEELYQIYQIFARFPRLCVWGVMEIIMTNSNSNKTQTRHGNLGWKAASFFLAVVGALSAAPMDHCDVIVADSSGTVYLFNPQTQERTVIARGVKLDRPYKLILDCDGNIVVSDTGTLRIVRINPRTREQTVLADGPAFGVPFGLAVDQHKRIYVANSMKILCIDPNTSKIEPCAEGGFLQAPLDLVVAPDGSLYVADAFAGVIRIDPVTKAQTLMAKDGLSRPVGIAIDGNHTLYVADTDSRCIVAIDLHNNSQRLVSQGGFLTTPVAIALAPGGIVLVSDPDAFNLDGGIMAIDRDGHQTEIMRGSGELVNPRGFLIVHRPVRDNSTKE